MALRENKPVFIAAIPVISRSVSQGWQVVEENLNATVKSLLGTNERELRIAIAHHEKPDISHWDDPRVISIPVDWAIDPNTIRYSGDKQTKRKAVAAWAKREFSGCYIMFLDADDLVHVDLPGFVLDDDNRAGYSIENGYRYDTNTGDIQPIKETFHRSCGSCFIGYFEPHELPEDISDNRSVFSQICKVAHKEQKDTAASLGKNIQAVPFHAAVYVTNHAASLRAMETGEYTRKLNVAKLLERERAAELLAESFNYIK